MKFIQILEEPIEPGGLVEWVPSVPGGLGGWLDDTRLTSHNHEFAATAQEIYFRWTNQII